jgi:mitogen-activated protein kinase kinase kinase
MMILFLALGLRWIKGALIGAGSFGKVYLGMDATTGLLMAVKQVDLPTAASINKERKQAMLTALEREMELLKDLEHEHIVQYLCMSRRVTLLSITLS